VVTDQITACNHFADLSPRPAILVTDIFIRYGASFNKGAALSEGFATIKHHDWILNFDADILPPDGWREICEESIFFAEQSNARRNGRSTKLFGCSHRYREDGTLIPDSDFPNLWGMFHLWNVYSPYTWRRPVFDSTVGHAGNYDHSFLMQFPENERVDFWPDLHLIHQGEPRQRWFGRDPKNDKKMMNLFTLGLWDAWLTRAGHIKIPPPEEVIINAVDKNRDDIVRELDKYTVSDPFKYDVKVKWKL
jgi:glycosyltransferase involved in cell wall biosynthesis